MSKTFQSTFPRGERQEESEQTSVFEKFQSTFPRGERQLEIVANLHSLLFQSTFPRGERLISNGYIAVLDISIHVPAWGTTRRKIPERKRTDISIHVPAWGTTALEIWYEWHGVHFNPRSRVGNDCKFSQIFFAFLCNKYNFSTFYYPFSLFFGVIHFTFLIFAVRILPIFYVYF